MAITRGIRAKLETYGLNLPVDKRTRAYKKLLSDNKWTEAQYVSYLKQTLKRYTKKEKEVIRQVQKQKIKQEVAENVRTRNQRPKQIIKRFLQKSVQRNKIFRIEPTNSAWKSYEKYTINNMKSNLFTKYESLGKYDYTEVFDIGTVKDFIEFYQIDSFITSKAGSKIWLEGIYSIRIEDEVELIEDEKNVTTKAKVILTYNDTNEMLMDFYEKSIALNESYKTLVKRIERIHIHIAKVNPLTASSYIDLPANIKNKKACINIKNKDNLCFLYSVLCGINTPERDAERVSKYTGRLDELIYDLEDMPMDINKIIHFEKRNKLRINVFGLEGQYNQVIPLYNTKQRTKTDYKLIHLLYYKPEGTNGHYCYIKNFNALMSNQHTSKKDHHQNLVCPYCCEFTAHGGQGKKAMEKHMEQCIGGQKVKIPKQEKIKFSHFNNIN